MTALLSSAATRSNHFNAGDRPGADGRPHISICLEAVVDAAAGGLTIPRYPRGSAIYYRITSSARMTIDDGMLRPSVLAVRKFTTSRYSRGCSTGNSAAFAPLRILSTRRPRVGSHRGDSGRRPSAPGLRRTLGLERTLGCLENRKLVDLFSMAERKRITEHEHSVEPA